MARQRYADVQDVLSRVPDQFVGEDGFTESTRPKRKEVEDWLDSQSGWVDSTLRWKYVVPITDSADRAMLRPIVAALVASQVWTMIGGHGAEMPANGPALRREALEMLAYNKATGQSMVTLANTALSEVSEAEVGMPTSSFTDPDADGSVGHPFEMGQDNW